MNRPTVSPWATFWRASGTAATRIALAALVLFFVLNATAQTTNTLSDAEIQGRVLAQKILEQQPAENFTNTGVLKIRDANGNDSQVPLRCLTIVTGTNWSTIYTASWTNKAETLMVVHTPTQSNLYADDTQPVIEEIPVVGHLFRSARELSGAEKTLPFANSDFWIADLGLDFFHWPEQTVLKKKINQFKGRDYTLLESTNPESSTNGYSRVVSWIDNETLGLLQADAYDHDGKLLKEFYPKDFKKVNGQWQVQTLVIENEQTGSRSRLEFDLKK